jgi:hypothetical protein
MRQFVFELGAKWAVDAARPRISGDTLNAWARLIDDWIADENVPLLVRKHRSDRGYCLVGAAGRTLVPTDNSPAQWAFAVAHSGYCPQLEEITTLLASGELPVAMALKTEERARAVYKGTRGKCPGTSESGWKLAHIEDVALGGRGSLIAYPLSDITAYFAKFMSPKNMLVVPAEFSGLAEVPAFIAGYCSAVKD